MEDYLKAIRSFAADAEFRSELTVDPSAALRRRGLRLGNEQLAALTDMAREDDGTPANAQGRIGRWFQYADLTPSALSAR